MVKYLRSWLMLVVLLFCTIFLTGCMAEFEYIGETPELFSAATAMIPGLAGEFSYGPVNMSVRQPMIITLEEDDFGRILFSYDEGRGDTHILIVQKVEDNYVYFYPHYNFLFPAFVRSLEYSNKEENINILKEANSWNKELSDTAEFERAGVVHHRERGPVPDEQLIEMYNAIFPTSTINRNRVLSEMFYLRTDRYGRSIYNVGGPIMRYVDGEPTRISVGVVALFQPDHTFDIETGVFEIGDYVLWPTLENERVRLVVTDNLQFHTDLRLFMESNDWNVEID